MPRKFHEYPIYISVAGFTKLMSYFYKLRNSRQPKLLIYTDSRGFEISKSTNKKNPFSSYVGEFVKAYNVDYEIYPKKHTTILDFLESYKAKTDKYDAVILHAGIVDFSPRPKSGLKKIYEEKEHLLKSYFPVASLEENLKHSYGSYENEETASIYSLEMAQTYVLPELKKIPNLIWISCNPVLEDWQGSYFKERPESMTVINDYCQLFEAELERVLALQDWTKDEIKRRTVDNIHYSEEGFRFLADQLEAMLNK